MSEQALRRYVDFFESLTPNRLVEMEEVFAPEARFSDPFNDVFGVEAIEGVFRHMYATTEGARFEVIEAVAGSEVCFLFWRFYFLPRGKSGFPWCIEGTSRVRFDRHGKVVEHIDYWDPAMQLYARLPVIGALMRWLRRRFQAQLS